MVFVIHNFDDMSKRTRSVVREDAMQLVSEEAYMLFVRLIHAHNSYEGRFDVLTEKLAGPDFNPCDSREFRDLLETKDQVQQAFQDLISIHPSRDVIRSYITAMEVFAIEQSEEEASCGWTIWQPPYTLQTRHLINVWKTAEVAYVALGYRSVPLVDWMNSVNFSNITRHLPRSVFPLLLQPLEVSERPVFHADKWLNRHPRLMFV